MDHKWQSMATTEERNTTPKPTKMTIGHIYVRRAWLLPETIDDVPKMSLCKQIRVAAFGAEWDVLSKTTVLQ
eukprot:3464562-Amphidinium_carterae.1